MKPVVAHLTSVHPFRDNRIFYKICTSLCQAGYDVYLIAPKDEDECVDGIRVLGVRQFRHRLLRMVLTQLHVLLRALRLNARVYHFHDLELVFTGLVLRLLGKRVIYDVHEDYTLNVAQKRYLPAWVKRWMAPLLAAVERVCAKLFTIVLAERHYSSRFPGKLVIANYPVLSEDPSQPTPECDQKEDRSDTLIYTGNVNEDRGALLAAELVKATKNIRVFLVGRCSAALWERIRATAGAEAHRIQCEGVEEYVPFSRITEYYRNYAWLAGFAVFPRIPHYLQKENTKLFEYMYHALPVVCSDYPRWKALVEGCQAGVIVNPDDIAQAAHAVEQLRQDAGRRRAMGENGRRAVLEQFNWETEAAKLRALYANLLGELAPPAASAAPQPAPSIGGVHSKAKHRSHHVATSSKAASS